MSQRIRQSNTGNSHLAVDSLPDPICGTPNTFPVGPADIDDEHAEKNVTCSKCRHARGWPQPAGSFAARTARGLDSSAWGANKGR